MRSSHLFWKCYIVNCELDIFIILALSFNKGLQQPSTLVTTRKLFQKVEENVSTRNPVINTFKSILKHIITFYSIIITTSW